MASPEGTRAPAPAVTRAIGILALLAESESPALSLSDLARGLGLADLLSDDAVRREQVVDFWGRQLASVFAAR